MTSDLNWKGAPVRRGHHWPGQALSESLKPSPVEAGSAPIYDESMERVVNIARSHQEADDWDIRQQVAMSPQERIRAARELRHRAYPPPNKDVRECHDKP